VESSITVSVKYLLNQPSFQTYFTLGYTGL